MTTVRLLVVDDHDFFLRSILALLKLEANIEIVATATSGDQAITLCKLMCPDVVLMDMNLPNLSGLMAMKQIATLACRPIILVLTGMDDAETVRQAFHEGASGYLRKDMLTDELLINAILTVASGGVLVDNRTFSLIKPGILCD